MMIGLLGASSSYDFGAMPYIDQAAIVRRAQVERRPLPLVEVGTGGQPFERFVRQDFGYLPYVLLEPAIAVKAAPYAKLMEQVKAGFGRTMSRLPEVFGVSRQTLYNWLDGETPKAAHQERLRQLAEAAKIFSDVGIKPTAPMLERQLSHGKTCLQLLAAGADGKETAKKLARILQRGSESRANLDKILAGRKAELNRSDLGAPAFDEES